MKINLQENEITLIDVCSSSNENGNSRNVIFEINGKRFHRDILLTKDDAEIASDPETFYLENKEAVDNSLIEFLSENHLYFNQ